MARVEPRYADRVRNELGLKPGAELLCFVANFRAAKNHHLVLDVAKALGTSYTVVLVGDGPKRGSIEDAHPS